MFTKCRIAASFLLIWCYSVIPNSLLVSDAWAQNETSLGPDFNREVRPVLAQYCFKCHGADEGSRQGGLRLDLRDAALGNGDSGNAAIVPGDEAGSELVRRILSTDDSDRMPPSHTKTELPEAAKKLLQSWVASGAKYDKHWAYVAPDRAKLDQVLAAREGAEAKLHPIDFFVRKKVQQAGLEPSPQADPYTLVRRVCLDLTGLPPTPAEADAFVSDTSENAYERLVDKLLQSPRYGERWARRWLDLARYADTNGFEKDRTRTIWPYRDWVIRALNEDMPYDQFSIKQLAGDMLDNPSADDMVATGFHRNTMLNEEGGIDPLEYRFYAMVDRVGVTGTTWLGLTLNCVQCHTHKYDPIQHSDFYRLMAFLDNADEPNYFIPPAAMATKDTATKSASKQEELAKLIAALPEKHPGGPAALDSGMAAWVQDLSSQSSSWQVVVPSKISTNLPNLEVQADGYLLGSGDITKSDLYELELKAPIRDVRAIRIEVASHPSLPSGGPGLTYYEGPVGGFFLSELQAFQGDLRLKISHAEATNDSEEDRINDAQGPAKKVKAKDNAKGDKKVAAKKSGDKKNNASAALDAEMSSGWQVLGGFDVQHSAVFQFAEPVDLSSGVSLKMLFEKHFACSLGHFRISVTSGEHPSATGLPTELEAIIAKLPADLKSVDTKPQDTKPEDAKDIQAKLASVGSWLKKNLSSDQLMQLTLQYCETIPELDSAIAQIDALKSSAPRGQQTLVMKERPASNPRPTMRHHRGEFLQPKEKVDAGLPAFLPPLPENVDANRLNFARWLFSPEHPLTARVTVNRQWQAFFGRGLVKSLEDFGYQSEPPSHPELLDWMATEFMQQGWSMKRLHRMIVTSQTYKQSSRVTPEASQRDPENIWLARGARFRLEAEIIRDSALSASGLLSTKMGGPGVYPPQPASVTTEGTYGRVDWKTSEGEDRYRRSIYTFIKRTAPFAMATTFDAPSGESCLARREVSNSPLQALTLLNDQMFMELAEAMAKRVVAESDKDEPRLTSAFRRCATRPPSAEELERLKAFLEKQRERKIDDDKVWSMLCRALMNLDEAITHP